MVTPDVDVDAAALGVKRLKISRNKPDELLTSGLVEETISHSLDTLERTHSFTLLPVLFKRLASCLPSPTYQNIIASYLSSRPDRALSLRHHILAYMSSKHKPTDMRGLETLQAAVPLCRALKDNSLVQPLIEHALAAPRSSKRDMLILSHLLQLMAVKDIPSSLLDECLIAIGNCEVPAYLGKILVQLLENEQYMTRRGSESHLESIATSLSPVLLDPPTPITLTMISRHVLPSLLSSHHSLCSLLLSRLSSSSIDAWIDLASVSTSLSLIRPKDLEESMLRLAIHHADHKVRVQAFRCLTAAGAASERVDERAWEWLREWMGSNADVHSAEFRSVFGSLLAKFCGRLQLTYKSALRGLRPMTTAADPNVIQSSESYLSYVRSYLSFLLDSVVDRAIRLPLTTNHARMMIALDMLEKIADVADIGTDGIMVEVWTEKRVEMVVRCLGSNFTEVRQKAMSILLAGPSPLPGWSCSHTSVLLSDAYDSLLGARNTQAEAGKLLIKLVFANTSTGASALEEGQKFFRGMLDRLEDHVSASEQDLASGLEEKPMHGVLSAIAGVIECLNLLDKTASSPYIQPLHLLIDLIYRVWSVCSPVLCLSDDGSADHEIARVYDMLETDDVDEGGHLVVLSSCWRAMKEAASLLSTMISTAVYREKVGPLHSFVWADGDIVATGKLFRLWLSSIRHRGAFSSIAPCFEVFVRAVRPPTLGVQGGIDAGVRDMCAEWLEADLATLRVATASTTRRSAAIPYSILALVHGDQVLFMQACTSLLEVAENEGDRYTSLVQTHALNVLSVIILDARQSGFFPFVAEQTTTTALKKIASAQWNVKNAALLLFAGLTTRMVGRQVNYAHEDLRNSKTLQEWATTYPSLSKQLLVQLHAAMADPSQRMTVFPTLALLRHWQIGEPGSDLQNELLAVTEYFVDDREWKVREIAAQASSALIGAHERLIAGRCHLEAAISAIARNARHGRLLQVKALVEREQWAPCCHQQYIDEFMVALEAAADSILATTSAPPEAASLLDIARILQRNHPLPTKLYDALNARAQQVVQSEEEAGILAGQDLLTISAAMLTDVESGAVSCPAALRALLRDRAESGILLGSSLWNLALSPAVDVDIRVLACESLAVKDILPLSRVDAQESLMAMAGSRTCVPLAEAALRLLPNVCGSSVDVDQVNQITEMVRSAIKEDMSEESRMAALQCLQVLYAKIPSSNLAVDLLVWTLLSDDDEDVRNGATSIIHDKLAPKTSLCRDRAAEVFWQHLLATYRGSEEWNRWLWSKVVDRPMIEKHLEEVSKSNFVLFATEAPNLYRQEYDDVARAAEALIGSTPCVAHGREGSYWLRRIHAALGARPRISPIDSRGDSVRILQLIAEQLGRLSSQQ